MNDLVKEYVESHEKYDNQQEVLSGRINSKEQQICRLQQQLEKLKKQKKNIKSPIPWTDVLCKIKGELENISGLVADFSGPFGIRSAFSIALFNPELDKEIWDGYYLVVTPEIVWNDDPHRVVDLKFYYDTGETTSDFEKGSLGSLNGMNNKRAPLPLDAKAIFEIMKIKKVNKTTIL